MPSSRWHLTASWAIIWYVDLYYSKTPVHNGSSNQKSFNKKWFLSLRDSKAQWSPTWGKHSPGSSQAEPLEGRKEIQNFNVYLFCHILLIFFFLVVGRYIKYVTVQQHMHIVQKYINMCRVGVCSNCFNGVCIHTHTHTHIYIIKTDGKPCCRQ